LARKTTTYDLLVSCPGDVIEKGYLDAIENSVNQFNTFFGKFNNVNLQVVHWSKDSYPESGGSAQSLLNSQIVDESDAAVALLFTRFGTPTDEFGSGTEEEIERMIASGKQVFMYFIEEPINPSVVDWDQYQRVKDFKSRYTEFGKGLYGTVTSAEQLTGELVNHLSLFFLKRIVDTKHIDGMLPQIEIVDGENEKKYQLNKLSKGFDEFLLAKNNAIIKRMQELSDSVLQSPQSTRAGDTQNVQTNFAQFSLPDVSRFSGVKSVKFSENEVDILNGFAKQNNFDLHDDFFSLGNLTQNPHPIIQGFGASITGTREEKERYQSVERLCDDIQMLQSYREYFEKLQQLRYLKLAVTNVGRSFDEDIDITLKVAKNSIVKPNELPIPGELIISEFQEQDGVNLLFGLSSTAKTDEYDSGYTATPRFADSITSMPGLHWSRAEIAKKKTEEYQNDIESIFQYDFFSDDGFDLIKFHVGYLKQHSSMWLPTPLVFLKATKQIDYSITSKHLPDVVSGSIDVTVED
jgi:hypothetical protein